MLRHATRLLPRSNPMRRIASTVAAPATTTQPAAQTTTITPAPPGDGPNHRSILALDGDAIRPYVQPNSFVAPSASVIGSVVVNDKTAIMYGSVIRGDLALIHVGAVTVIGDNCTLTAGAVDSELSPSDAISAGLSVDPELFVGDYTFVGPNCSLTSCHLDGMNIIGAGSTIGPGASIGRGSRLEPNSVVEPDTEVPDAELWGGNPAQKIADISPKDIAIAEREAELRTANTVAHAYEFLPHGFGYLEKERSRQERLAA